MAALSSAEIDKLSAIVQSDFSRDRKQIPVDKGELRAMIVDVDRELDAAESAILTGVKGVNAKAWLADQTTFRLVIEYVARHRKEVL